MVLRMLGSLMLALPLSTWLLPTNKMTLVREAQLSILSSPFLLVALSVSVVVTSDGMNAYVHIYKTYLVERPNVMPLYLWMHKTDPARTNRKPNSNAQLAQEGTVPHLRRAVSILTQSGMAALTPENIAILADKNSTVSSSIPACPSIYIYKYRLSFIMIKFNQCE